MKQAMTITKKTFLIFGLLLLGSLAFGQNNAPIAVDDYVVDYGDVNSIFLLDNDYDPNGDDLTLTIVIQPNHATASVGYHSWYGTYITSFNLNSAFVGSDSLTYQICDNAGLCDLAKLYITILPSSPPIAVDDVLTTFENKIVVGDFRQNDIDVDNQSLYMSLNSPPVNGSTTIYNTTASYLPDSGFIGLDSFYYNVCDEFSGYNQLCDIGKVYVNVLPNTAPVAVNDTITDCSRFSFSPIQNDYDNTGNFRIDTNLVQEPSNGTIKFEYYSSYWRYYSDTINPIEIHDTFAYRICDYGGLCDTAWVFINISPTDFLQLDSISYTDEICNNGEGEVLFHSSSYQPFVTYTLNDNLLTYNNPHFTNLNTGTYYPIIKTGVCVKELSPITIAQSSTKPIFNNITLLNDNSANLDTLIIAASSNSSPLEYSVNGGFSWQFSDTFPSLSLGTYNIMARSSSDCEVSYPYNPVIISSLDTNMNITKVHHFGISDCGMNDGFIAIQIAGTNNAYEYTIDSGNTWVSNSIFTNLFPNTYHIAVRNPITLETNYYATPIIIEARVEPIIDSVTVVNPSSSNTSDGTITIHAYSSLGTPLNYSLDGGTNWQPSPVFSSLHSGTYNVSVRHTDGTCMVLWGAIFLNINTANPPTNLSVNTTDATSCSSNDGTITISVDNSQNYVYSIDNGQSWQTDSLFQNLGISYYNLYLKEIISNSIFATYSMVGAIQISSPTQPIITNINTTPPTSCNASDATITINTTGGNGNLIYKVNGGNWQSSNVITGLDNGSYSIKVRNSDFTCPEAWSSTQIIDSLAPVLYLVDVTHPYECNNGSMTILANTLSGNALEYSIDNGNNWSSNNVFNDLSVANYNIAVRKVGTTCQTTSTTTLYGYYTLQNISITHTNPTTCSSNDGTITVHPLDADYEYSLNSVLTGSWSSNNTFTGLSCGYYNVFARRKNGYCLTNVGVVSLNANNFITTVNHTNLTGCNGTDGTITIQTIANNNLEYSINNGITWLSNNGTFTNLDTGSYHVLVREIGTMNIDTFANNPVILTAPNAPSITNVVTTDPTDCGVTDGIITIIAIGGSAPLEYSIDGGLSWIASNSFTGLAGGTYQIRVRNANGTCEVVYPNVTLIDKVPPTITNVTFTNPTTCGANDGTITITASGNDSLQYSINGGTTWIPYFPGLTTFPNTSNTFTGLQAGTYQIRVRNIDGTCVVSTANVVITAPTPLTITNVTFTNPSNCSVNDGTITITTTGGMSPLEYSIDGGVNFVANGGTFVGLSCGTYDVRVRNANGSCEVIYGQVVLPTYVTVSSVISSDTSCTQNGTITIAAQYGTGNYQYSIDSGLTWQTTANFTNLTVGNYHVLVTDGLDTTAYANNPISMVSNAPVITAIIKTNPTDCNTANGSIQIMSNNPSAYLYYINGSNWQTSNIYNNLNCGFYPIWVKDVGSTCQISLGNIRLYDTLEIVSVTIEDKICGQQEGKISINAILGFYNYQYSIDSGSTWQTVDSFTNLTPDNYHVLVTDGNDTLAYANNPIVINEMGTPTINAMYGGDFVFVNSIAATNLEYSLDCGATWQNNNFFNGISGTTFCSGVRYNDGSCPLFSTDTFINTVPIAINDSISFPKLNVKTFNILTNDVDAEGNHLYVKNTPQTINLGSGSITIDSLGNVTVPTANFNFGTYNFDYIVCESYNPTHCDTASVAFTIYPPSHHIFDTIAIGATAQICIPNNLNGTSVSLTNVCGTIPNVVIDSIVGECLYLYADNYGDATTCFVRCDNLGDCDTTFLHFTVQDGVWPGDADDNTIVNNFDLLNVGLGYGTSGTARDSVTNVWNGYITPLWNVATPVSNVDYRHLDGNGDGFINADDTLAIMQNYGLSYQRGGGGNFGTPLSVLPDTSYVLPYFSLPIHLGELSNPAGNIYGGAFSILYDTTYIKKDSVFITFNNSWVGTKNVDMLSIDKNFGNNQQIDVAFTRINGTNVTGFGEIGQLNFTIKDDILQRGMTLDSVIFDFHITNVKFISADEQEVNIAANSTAWVVFSTTSTNSVANLAQWINVFPNPTTNYVQIQSQKLTIENITVTDMVGRTVLENIPTDKRNIQLNISELPQGVYHIQLQTERGMVVKQLVVLE